MKNVLHMRAVAALFAAALSLSPVSALAEGPGRLDVASTFPISMLLGGMGQVFADNVAIATDGAVKMRMHNPGDLVPTFEVFDAVSSGAVSAGWDWMGYWAKVIPAAKLYGGLPFGPTNEVSASWMWEGGGMEIMQEEYDKHNVVFLPCFIEPSETGGYYNKEITGPEDYQGLKMRISGLGADVLTKLGASTQLIPGGETFLALERGRVEAIDYAIPTVDEQQKFYEIAKYNYFPGWHQTSSWFSFIINKDVWEQYSEGRRKQFELACRATVQYSLARLAAEQVDVLRRMEAKGLQVRELPDSVLTAVRAAWEGVLAEQLEDPLFRRAYESLQEHQAKIDRWNNLQALDR